MNVRVLIKPTSIHFMDNDGKTFLDMEFPELFVEVNKNYIKEQDILIFAPGLNADVYSYSNDSEGREKIEKMGFIKTLKRIAEMDPIDDYKVMSRKSALDGGVSSLPTVFEGGNVKSIMDEAQQRIKAIPDPELKMRIFKDPVKNCQDIYVDIVNVCLGTTMKPLTGLTNVTQMTSEMNMNSLIFPPPKGFGSMNVTAYLKNCFAWMVVYRQFNNRLLTYIPELVFNQVKQFEPREQIQQKVFSRFREELDDPLIKELSDSLDDQLLVAAMGALIKNLSMHIIHCSDIQGWVTELKIHLDPRIANTKFKAREVLHPVKEIEYKVEAVQFSDKFHEVNFSGGMANLTPVFLTVTTHDLHLLIQWNEFVNSKQYWNDLAQKNSKSVIYEEKINKILKKNVKLDWLSTLTKVQKSQLRIQFGGLWLNILDDIFGTNQEILKFQIHPLSTTQYNGYKGSGMSKFNLKLDAIYFNHTARDWEPFLENFKLAISMYSSKDKGSVTEVVLLEEDACINVTTELVTLMVGIQNQRNFRIAYRQYKKTMDTVAGLMIKEVDFNPAQNMNMIPQREKSTYESLTTVNTDASKTTPPIDLGKSSAFAQSSYVAENKTFAVDNRTLDFEYKQDPSVQTTSQMNQLSVYHSKYTDTARIGSMINSKLRASMMGSSKISNPVKQRFADQTSVKSISVSEYTQLKEESKNLQQDVAEVDLKYCPYQIHNMSGYEILIIVSLMNSMDSNSRPIKGKVFCNKDELVEIPFPNLKTLETQGFSYEPSITFYTIEPVHGSKDYNAYRFYQTNTLENDLCMGIVIDVGGHKHQIVIKNTAKMFKRSIRLSSPYEISNETEIDIAVFNKENDGVKYNDKKRVLKEHQKCPIMHDSPQFSLAIEDNGNKVFHQHAISFSNLYPSGEENLLGKKNKTLSVQLEQDTYVNLFTKKLDNNTRSKIKIVPPIIINNKVLNCLHFYLVKSNMDKKKYGIKHKIETGRHDYEIYENLFSNTMGEAVPLNKANEYSSEKMCIRVSIGKYRSQDLQITINDNEDDPAEGFDFWLFDKNRKKIININLVKRFNRGSIIIDIFMEAMLVDQLFLQLKYSQNIGVSEERIYPINKDKKDMEDEDNALNAGAKAGNDYGKGMNSFMSTTWNGIVQSVKNKFASGKEETAEPSLVFNKIFFLQKYHPVYLADLKYVYESTEINTKVLGNQDHKLFYYDNRLGRGEYYDCVVSINDYVFGNILNNSRPCLGNSDTNS